MVDENKKLASEKEPELDKNDSNNRKMNIDTPKKWEKKVINQKTRKNYNNK